MSLAPFTVAAPLDDDAHGAFGRHALAVSNVDRDVAATGQIAVEESLGGPTLASVLARWPAMTARVLAAIHWQAFFIWLRRNPVYDHPRKASGGSP